MLSHGPVSTRARKPSAITSSSQSQPVSRMSTHSSATPPATARAAFSFTGLGNPSTPAVLTIHRLRAELCQPRQVRDL